jgi:hypothetical protein
MREGFQLILSIPISVGAISQKIWDMVNRFAISVYTSSSGLLPDMDISNAANTSFREQL